MPSSLLALIDETECTSPVLIAIISALEPFTHDVENVTRYWTKTPNSSRPTVYERLTELLLKNEVGHFTHVTCYNLYAERRPST